MMMIDVIVINDVCTLTCLVQRDCREGILNRIIITRQMTEILINSVLHLRIVRCILLSEKYAFATAVSKPSHQHSGSDIRIAATVS